MSKTDRIQSLGLFNMLVSAASKKLAKFLF